jgi:hypothetical protein
MGSPSQLGRQPTNDIAGSADWSCWLQSEPLQTANVKGPASDFAFQQRVIARPALAVDHKPLARNALADLGQPVSA